MTIECPHHHEGVTVHPQELVWLSDWTFCSIVKTKTNKPFQSSREIIPELAIKIIFSDKTYYANLRHFQSEVKQYALVYW